MNVYRGNATYCFKIVQNPKREQFPREGKHTSVVRQKSLKRKRDKRTFGLMADLLLVPWALWEPGFAKRNPRPGKESKTHWIHGSRFPRETSKPPWASLLPPLGCSSLLSRVARAVLSLLSALRWPGPLSRVLSHLPQQMMTSPSARHMELVMLSKSLSQPGPRDYFKLSCESSFLSRALIVPSTTAAVEAAYLVIDVCRHSTAVLWASEAGTKSCFSWHPPPWPSTGDQSTHLIQSRNLWLVLAASPVIPNSSVCAAVKVQVRGTETANFVLPLTW